MEVTQPHAKELSDIVSSQQTPAHARETPSGWLTRVTLEVLAFGTATGDLVYAVRCLEQGEYLKGTGFAALGLLLYVGGLRLTHPQPAAEGERESGTGSTGHEHPGTAPQQTQQSPAYAPEYHA